MPEFNRADPPRQTNYETALLLAREQWAAAEFSLQCERAGAKIISHDGAKTAQIIFLDQVYRISHPEGRISREEEREGESEVPLAEQIILLHYLCGASGREPTGKLIAYQEIPDCMLYHPNFIKRTAGILSSVFRDDVDAIFKAGLAAGGIKADAGDLGLRFQVLPRIPILLTLWRGDEELPSSISILFDDTVTGYLPTEDITVISGMLALKITRSADREQRVYC